LEFPGFSGGAVAAGTERPWGRADLTKSGWQLTDDQRLTGRIERDPDRETRMPMVVIDGKPFTWEQVGHMLMTFEGFTPAKSFAKG
jgi:hypothetical protein